jgi:poly-gamma-glutamate capsule biosynthesis protein CapA/YwtB (metallophosphatase superfamily)
MNPRRHPLRIAQLLAATAVMASLSFSGELGAQQAGCRADDAQAAPNETLTLRAVGDMVLGSDWPTPSYPPDFESKVLARLKQVLGEADVKFGNLEGVLSAHDVSKKKPRPGAVYAFRMPPRFARLLKDAGFDVINVANNHSFDFGQKGYDDTVENLADAGILPVGEKDMVSIQQVKDVRLAWIGFSYLDRNNDMHDGETLAALVDRARRAADLVIVSVHAGAEGSEALRVGEGEEIFLGEHRGDVVSFARRAVDLGADLVLAHGPHVLRGMECYRGRLIAYSLGNFVGYGALSAKRAAGVSAILEVRLAKDRRTLGFDVVPIRFDDEHLPNVDERGIARYLIEDLSARAPLNGSVSLVDGVASEAYRAWLDKAELTSSLDGPGAAAIDRAPRR